MSGARRLGLLCVVAAAGLPSAGAADLLHAWQAARSHDPAFAAARAQWQAGQTRARQAQALWRPEVSLVASAGLTAGERNTTGAQFSAPGVGAASGATFKTSIDGGPATVVSMVAQQPVYNPERRASARQLERQSELADAEFRRAEQELVLRAAQAYFAVIIAEEALATLHAQKQAAARALEVASGRYEEGAVPVTDRNEARARFDDIATQEIVAQDDLHMQRVTLSDLTGATASPLSRMAKDAALERYTPGALAEWLARAEQANPLIAMQALGRSIAHEELEKFRALVSPAVDVYARLSDERMQDAIGHGDTRIRSSAGSIGVQITIPIFTGGMRSAKRDEAAALVQKAEHDIATVRQEVLRQTQAAWLATRSGIARVRAQEQAVRSAGSRLDATAVGNEVGARTTLDLLNAQSDFYHAQRNLEQVKYQLLLDRLRLAATAGELGEATLREVNAVLTDSR